MAKLERIPREVLDLVPARFVERHRIVPLATEAGDLLVAHPVGLSKQALDELGLLLGLRIRGEPKDPAALAALIQDNYGLGAPAIESLVKADRDRRSEGATDGLRTFTQDLEGLSEDAAIVSFVNHLIQQGFKDGATDIHLEPYENHVRVRARIDGLLHDVQVPAEVQRFHTAIVSRLKVMAGLDIAERRLPQDGRIRARIGSEEIDLRLSILPTIYGESVDIRLLANAAILRGLESLGFEGEDIGIVQSLLRKPHGVILVTGPTGSGKTTTLYSFLNTLNEHYRKIITIEDPIEYKLDGITQIQVRPKIGLGFAQGLRSMLRHDPDVMMVGEIRDQETAETVIRVALTGHLVFSTVHTNDAPSTPARLMDMGIEPYLVASSVECIIAQRLVRLVCQRCARPIPTPRDAPTLGISTEAYKASYPELNLYTTNANGSIADTTGLVIDCAYSGSAPDTTNWIQYQTDLPVNAQRAKFVVYAYMRSPSHGTIWLDDVSLIQLTSIRPLHELAGNPSMERGSSGSSLPDSFQAFEGGTIRGWSRFGTAAHSGSYVLKFEGNSNNGVPYSPSDSIGQSFAAPTPGRYLLTAWVKAVSVADLRQTPEIMLLTDSTKATALGDEDASRNRWNPLRWTKLHAILNVQSNTAHLWFTIRTRQPGTFYVDDVCLRRIDGDLHNLVDRVYKPVVQSTDLQTTYVRGQDYEVSRGPLYFRYDETAVPTRILKPYTGSNYGAEIKASYDLHLFWDYERAGWQSRNLCDTCSTGVLRSLFNRGSRRVLALGASGIHMDLSELRGLNRSGSARKDSRSNAWVLGSFANAWSDTIHAINANAVVYESGDMISPYANGARRYESDWGGTSDPTYRVTEHHVTQTYLDSSYVLRPATRVHSWFYYPRWFGSMSATAGWFQVHGYAMTQDTWYDTTNVMEAAAVSRNLSLSLGCVATTWVDSFGQPSLPTPPGAADEDSLQQRWIRTAANRFWNTPWRQVYFTDFNEHTWPDSCRSCTGTARYLRSNAAAGLTHLFAPSWAPPGISWNDGGMLFALGGEGSVKLPKIFVDNGSAYRAILHHRNASGHPRPRDAYIVSRWYKNGVTTPDSIVASVSLGGTGDSLRNDSRRREHNFFWRSVVALSKPTTSKYDQLELKIRLANSGDSLSIDDVALWESDAPCVESDLDLSGPASVDLGAVPLDQHYSFTFQLQNRGCRDAHIRLSTVNGTSTRDSLDFNQTTPIYLVKNESITIGATSHLKPTLDKNFYLDIRYWGPGQVPGTSRLLHVPVSYTTAEESP